MAHELEVIIEGIESSVPDAEIAALQRIEGEMKTRIFGNGQATDGSKLGTFSVPRIGDYSRAHGRKRQRAGRRITPKDLEFYGDLRRSIGVGVNGPNTVLGFQYDKARIIAQAQQKQTRKTIFQASAQEIQNGIDVYLKRMFR